MGTAGPRHEETDTAARLGKRRRGNVRKPDTAVRIRGIGASHPNTTSPTHSTDGRSLAGATHACLTDILDNRHTKTSSRLLVATFFVPGMGVLLQMTGAHVWVSSKGLVGVATLLVLLRLLLVLGALDENPQLLKNKPKECVSGTEGWHMTHRHVRTSRCMMVSTRNTKSQTSQTTTLHLGTPPAPHTCTLRPGLNDVPAPTSSTAAGVFWHGYRQPCCLPRRTWLRPCPRPRRSCATGRRDDKQTRKDTGHIHTRRTDQSTNDIEGHGRQQTDQDGKKIPPGHSPSTAIVRPHPLTMR